MQMSLPGGGLFSAPKPPPIQEPPPIPDPIEIPDPDDLGKKNAKRRKFAQNRLRSGRASTVNTPSVVALG